ncbi:MAG: hypothetical protein IJ960_03890 [Oscillospiraceae bacterium]|nr:hypothetical protein [Oscillospiraceae bacterium]
MNRTIIRVICLVLCCVSVIGCTGCAAEGEAIVKKALTAIAENEKIQSFLEENDVATMTESAVSKLKESVPVLKEFLAREDVKEKFQTVGLPLIKEFLSYGLESMRLKAVTLGKIICIFAPELENAVDAIFETAPAE